MTQKQIGELLTTVLKKLYSSKGEHFAEIAANWPKLVGKEYASLASPMGIRYYKTNVGKNINLIVESNNASSRIELKFSESILLERINQYFGYKAVTSIQIR